MDIEKIIWDCDKTTNMKKNISDPSNLSPDSASFYLFVGIVIR